MNRDPVFAHGVRADKAKDNPIMFVNKISDNFLVPRFFFAGILVPTSALVSLSKPALISTAPPPPATTVVADNVIMPSGNSFPGLDTSAFVFS